MNEVLWFVYSSGYLIVAILFLLFAKFFFDLLTPYSVKTQMTEKDNPAMGVLLVGFLIGVAAVICSLFIGDEPETPTLEIFTSEIIDIVIYGAAGMALLFIAGLINDRIILRKFSNRKEIIEKQNVSVAFIVSSTYISSGLIIAGGIKGCVDLLSMLIAFAVGQVALVIFSILYQAATGYDDQKELGEHKNLAVGLAFGGNLLAYSLILMKGLSIGTTEFTEWSRIDRLENFVYYAIAGAVLLIITRLINDILFFPKVKVEKEIVQDGNINAGLMEAALAISMGSAMVFCL